MAGASHFDTRPIDQMISGPFNTGPFGTRAQERDFSLLSTSRFMMAEHSIIVGPRRESALAGSGRTSHRTTFVGVLIN